jgi:hypothetical protein
MTFIYPHPEFATPNFLLNSFESQPLQIKNGTGLLENTAVLPKYLQDMVLG